MKKSLILTIFLIICLAFTACGDTATDEPNSSSNKETVSEQSETEKPESKATDTESNEALSTYTEGNLTFKLPNGYKKNSDSPLMYVPADYPNSGDNVSILTTPVDPEFGAITKELYQKQLETLFSTITITEFKNATVSGNPAIIMKASYTLNDIPLNIAQLIISADQTYYFTYTYMDGDLEKNIDGCIASVTLS